MWVPPLHFELSERLDPRKNPFFTRAEVTLFTAWRDGRIVGRCSAQIDREHLRVWNDDTGFFGFFDTIDDEEVAKALLGAAEGWLRRRGMKRMLGPMSLYVNTEGTGKVDERKLEKVLADIFPLRPTSIRRGLHLNKPIYRRTAAYGHFGRPDLDLPWEELNIAAELRRAGPLRRRRLLPAGRRGRPT